MRLSPTLRPIADTGVLVEFADVIDDAVHQRVLSLDAALQAQPPTGLTEMIPAYASLFVGYDALQTDYATISNSITSLLNVSAEQSGSTSHWQIPVCYAEEFAPDMASLCDTLNLSADDIIAQHCSPHYKVYMYGFAPGYAYLGGVPDNIQVPRKTAPVMDIPVGSVMIAGPQSLITTVVMPSGWWVIGRTRQTPLQPDSDTPFLFQVGDTVQFVPVSTTEFYQQQSSPS